MTRQMISMAISQISDDFVLEAEEYVAGSKVPRRLQRWLTAAASIALVLGLGIFSVWFFTPSDTWGASENALRLTFVRVDDKMASYAFSDMSPYESGMLASWRGEPYREHGGTRFYCVKGAEDLSRLIMENDEGLHLMKFESWLQPMSFDRWQTSLWYTSGYLNDEDIVALDAESQITYGDTLSIIYGVDSAEGVRSIKFSDADIDKTDVGDSIKIKPVTLRDGESIERMYGILCSMTVRGAWQGWVRIFPNDEEYKNGTQPLSEQTERRVTVVLSNGSVLRFDYSPTSGIIKKYGDGYGAELSEQDNEWLISAAGIIMQYRYYGDAEQVSGAETAVPPRQPDEPTK